MTNQNPSNDNDDLRAICAEIFQMFIERKLTDAQGMTVMTLCTAFACESDELWSHFKKQVDFARMGIHHKVAGNA